MRLRILGFITITIGEPARDFNLKCWVDETGTVRARWKDLNDIRHSVREQSSHQPLRGNMRVITRDGFDSQDVEVHRIESAYHQRGERHHH